MAQGNITIEFKAKGNEALTRAIKQLDIATNKLKGTTSVYEKELKDMGLTQKQVNKFLALNTKNARISAGAFATLRSKLLLVAFASGLLTKAFTSLFGKFIEQEKAEKKLETALGKTNKALLNQASALQKVTTFGDEAIIGAQSLIAAFIDDEEQIKKATQATLDLASAKGMDLNAAADLVSKTLGSSTNSLSRYGIEVNGAVGSTKRLESLTSNISRLFGGQATAAAQTLGGSVEQMKNIFGDLAEDIGKTISPAIIPLIQNLTDGAKAMGDFFKELGEFDTETIVRKYEELGLSTENLVPLKVLNVTQRLTGNLTEQRNEITKLVTSNKSLIPTIASLATEAERGGAGIAGVDFAMGKGTVSSDKYNIILKRAETQLEHLASSLVTAEDQTSELTLNQLDQFTTLAELIAMIKKYQKTQEDADLAIAKITGTYKETTSVLLDFFEKFKNGFKGQEDAIKQFSQNTKMWSRAIMNVRNEYVRLAQARLDSSKAAELEAANSIRSERRRQREIDKINKKYAAEQDEINKRSKRAKRTQTVINTATSIMEVWADKDTGTFAKVLMSALVAKLGAAQLRTIDATKYEQGGLVGGRRHSQGGTMIEAERGEYVVSRRGVEAAGIEALNRINAGAGGGINVSINNPILSKDVVEDDLIPQIKEAIRRGADIGVG